MHIPLARIFFLIVFSIYAFSSVSAQSISADANFGIYQPYQYSKFCNPGYPSIFLNFQESLYRSIAIHYEKNNHKIGFVYGRYGIHYESIAYDGSGKGAGVAINTVYGLTYFYHFLTKPGGQFSCGLQFGYVNYRDGLGAGGILATVSTVGQTTNYTIKSNINELVTPSDKQLYLAPQIRFSLPFSKHFSVFSQLSLYFTWQKNQFFRSSSFYMSYSDKTSYDTDYDLYFKQHKAIDFKYYTKSEYFRDFRPTATVGIAYTLSFKK